MATIPTRKAKPAPLPAIELDPAATPEDTISLARVQLAQGNPTAALHYIGLCGLMEAEANTHPKDRLVPLPVGMNAIGKLSELENKGIYADDDDRAKTGARVGEALDVWKEIQAARRGAEDQADG